MTINKFELHGTSRFNIYNSCYIGSSHLIENIHVVIAGTGSIAYSILHLHFLKGTL